MVNSFSIEYCQSLGRGIATQGLIQTLFFCQQSIQDIYEEYKSIRTDYVKVLQFLNDKNVQELLQIVNIPLRISIFTLLNSYNQNIENK